MEYFNTRGVAISLSRSGAHGARRTARGARGVGRAGVGGCARTGAEIALPLGAERDTES